MRRLCRILQISLLILIIVIIYACIIVGSKPLEKTNESNVKRAYSITVDNMNDPVRPNMSESDNQKEEIDFQAIHNDVNEDMEIIQAIINDNSHDEEGDYEVIQTEYSYIETEGKVKPKELNQLVDQINTTVPRWLLDSFISNGWRIRLTSKDISKDYMNYKYHVNILAMTIRNEKYIIISKRGINNSVAHEFGHYLDVTNAYKCSNTCEFLQIYNEEVDDFKKNIINSGCVFNEAEFFAEAYYYSRIDPSKCTPKVLEYINKVSKSYEEGAHI